MSLDNFTRNEIIEIRNEVSRNSALLRSLVTGQATSFIDPFIKEVEKDPILGLIFHLLDRPLTQTEIVDVLRPENIQGTSQPSISRKLSKLEKEFGVIVSISPPGNKSSLAYERNESAAKEKILVALKANTIYKKFLTSLKAIEIK